MYIRGRGKIGYITGDKEEPDIDDPSHGTWDAENSMVMTWLVNSMEEEISSNYMCYHTAKELWDNVNQMYSDLGNQSQVYELTLKLGEARQGENNVTKYFNSLKSFWQDLDLFNHYEWKSVEDFNHYRKTVEDHRIFKFLAGLNVEFDEVRGRILGRQPLPSISEVFSEVRREESRRQVMLVKKPMIPTIENSALAAGNVGGRNRRSEDKPKVWCDHCNKSRHTRETCWKLHGKPANWKGSHEGKFTKNPTALEVESGPFSQEQISYIQKLLKPKSESLSAPSASVAHTGSAFSCSFPNKSNPWIIDSGASDHMTCLSHLFHTYDPCSGHEKIRIADGSFAPIAGKGSIFLSPTVCLKSVLHVPKLACNLLSVSKLSQDSNCCVSFFDSHCVFQEQTSGKMIGSAKLKDGLYYFVDEDSENKKAHGYSSVSSTSVMDQVILWHNRLGHPSFAYLQKLLPQLFNDIESSKFVCEHCILAKSHKSSYPSKTYVPSKPFSLIHSDVWGPSRVKTSSGKKWFVTFIDDHTRLCWVYLMSEKSEVCQLFQNFYKMVETQFQSKIRILHTDNGTEYINDVLGQFLKDKGILHQSTCVNTPQQNGIAERKNKHLLEVTRALMFSMNVPKYLWGEAILTATYLINRLPSRVLNFETPLNVFQKCFPDNRLHSILPLKVFGCIVYVHSKNQSKLDPRAEKYVFTGYAPNKKGYKCYNPVTRKSIISMDVTFLENQKYFLQGENSRSQEKEGNFWDIVSNPLPTVILTNEHTKIPETPSITMQGNDDSNTTGETLQLVPKQRNNELLVYTKRKHQQRNNAQAQPDQLQTDHNQNQSHSSENGNSNSGNPPDPTPIVVSNIEHPTHIVSDIEHSVPISDNLPADHYLPIALRKGKRSCTNHPLSKHVSYGKLSQNHSSYVSKVTNMFIPRNIQEALNDPDWNAAVMEEIHALEKNGTWDLVNLPKGQKLVGCKWLFTVKFRADGSVERRKVRLVAKGFTQTYGVDYQETFAPVAKINTIRILLSLAVNLDWSLHQLDVKNAFLNGDLEEDVFMCVPPGFERIYGKDKVCKLKKSLYGLKQSPRAWFDKFGRAVKNQGYCQSQADHTMFYRRSPEGKLTVLIVYVDDIIITGDDYEEIRRLKKKLAQEFELKDLGSLKYFLGMEFARSKDGIFVNQRKYILDLLNETGLLGCKAVETPVEPNIKLKPANPEDVVDREKFQRLVGKLIYLSHTRPDIAFVVSLLSQFMHSPGQVHFEAAYRVLKYLKGSPGQGLMFRKRNNLQIEVYTDADWAGNTSDRRSISGYCTFIGGNLVTWRSKKQSVVARSSAEAELRSLAHGICEAIWIKRVLEELQVPLTVPMKIYCDNKAAISIAHNPVLHDRTKHIEVDKHFIKEKIEEGLICIPYVPTSQQTADILTKGLPCKQFNFLVSKLAMEDIFKPA